MGKLCQCLGSCGHTLCCRAEGRVRKRVVYGEDFCSCCKGEPGRAARKRPAACSPEVLRRPAAASAQAVRDQEDGNLNGAADALARIAAALERLADGSRLAAQSTGPASVVLPEQELERGELLVPEVLRPVVAAVTAGGDADARVLVTALGFPPAHARRGDAFAVVQGILAVLCPGKAMAGLDTVAVATAAGRRRCDQFVRGHESLACIAVFADVGLATVTQSVARELRQSADLRRRHGQRFLAELAQHWSSACRQ